MNKQTFQTLLLTFSLSSISSSSFPKDMSVNLNKLFHLQGLLKKEHRSCVEMFERYALVSSQLKLVSFSTGLSVYFIFS